jgi:cytochrome b subunit of formate dehydrogenase
MRRGPAGAVPRAALRLPTGALLLFLASALGPALPAGAQLACEDCHEQQVAEESVHAGFACADCHSDVTDFPHPEAMLAGDAVCGGCHEQAPEVEASVHAGITDCGSCHGAPHEVVPAADTGSPVEPRAQLQTCGQCHDDAIIEAFAGSVHGDALLQSGLTVAPSCSGCHGAHSILPPSEPDSRVSHVNVPETCGDCHRFILEEWRSSAHGELWVAAQGGGPAADEPAPVCSTCHTSHAIRVAEEREARLASAEVCGRCHGEPFISYRDSFHGKANELGFAVTAVCADCHTPHQNLSASDPRSSVHPDNLAATCGACHGEMPAGFASFDPHNDPSDREDNAVVYWLWFFMTGLLIGVFAFFGLHTVLWLQRAIVAWARKEIVPVHDLTGPWVRRFRKAHRATHLLIIVTFLALAATGLPLKFSYTGWAQALIGGPVGFTVAHWVHRVAAVLTLGYALFHLGYLFWRVVVKRDGGVVWGWRSMVPRWRDLVEMLRNLRWFLYLGPRPAFDRFTYWEKFDYFAVFWGVPIIGVSGLMLWFPELFTGWLPGWSLNAAFLVHSDEALLATGFIFIFHFFHTHLRPESFPMDPVMFVGSMPLARFQEERPAEYRRLVEKGELEAHLVDPPTPGQIRRARIFGLSAVVVGLALAVGILVGLVAY